VTRADVLAHWTREHLACRESFVVDAEHALRLLPARTETYGLPRRKREAQPGASRAAPTPPPPECSPEEQQRLAAEAMAKVTGIGRRVGDGARA
jgi:hypothetical protein